MDLKIFTENVEPSALQQIYALKEHPAFKDEKVRVMPDSHAGVGCVIGLTATFHDKVVPNVVGVDIGCGVLATKMRNIPTLNLKEFDEFLRAKVPFGTNVHKSYLRMDSKLFEEVKEICERTNQDFERVQASIGTLGGGNHFIEIDDTDSGELMLVIHSGSRNFGLQVANFHQRKAIEEKGKMGGLEYLEGKSAKEYLKDAIVAQKYAKRNREAMFEILSEYLGTLAGSDNIVESVHNYIEMDGKFETGIIRKGAISAKNGEKIIIPFNMRDGSILGIGMGNEDWNYSAPHGAGRILSRSKAKELLSMEDFKESMKGIWTSCIFPGTLDEAPMAYKNKEEIIALIFPTVEVINTLRPIYNFKAQ